MGRILLALLLIAYLPGALIFRAPFAERWRRASLPVEERVFWSILLSLVLSSLAGLGLAMMGAYQFDRLLWVNGAVCLAILALGRGQFRLDSPAPYLTWTALLPLALVVGGIWLNFLVPPAEYIIGGRDPGVYMNEGIQIAQRGRLVRVDDVAASVPSEYRDLFFPFRGDSSYYSNRFMGFFLLDPSAGTVVGQFPHLYPAWIAIAYGVNGISGARSVIGLWAILGLLAVYFTGVRIMGRGAAAAGAGLLAVHVVQIWYARYPNAELIMQPLVFAGVLAFTRAQFDSNRFFAPVAAVILTLALFAHLTSALAIVGLAAAAVVGMLYGQRPRPSFVVPLCIGTGIAAIYLMTVLPPYFQLPLGFVRDLQGVHLGLLALLLVTAALLLHGAGRPAFAARARRWVPVGLVAAVWSASAYAFFIRSAGGRLAPHDADALRTFTSFYLTPLGLAAALLGFAIITWRSLWPGAPFLLTVATFSFFFFYKIRIVPEHFWAARRFLPVILPSALLLVGAAAFSSFRPPAALAQSWIGRRWRCLRYGLGGLLVVALVWQLVTASRPILRHVEYAGLIPRLEELAATFGDDDLVLVESRSASDVHVLALPLAYTYARPVLVFGAMTPDRRSLAGFLSWARGHYRRIFFVGGGGTELLSQAIAADVLAEERFQVPEYESALNAYPRRVRLKEFSFRILELVPRQIDPRGFELDVGAVDDLYVRGFLAKERHRDGFTFRWTRPLSYVSILGTGPDHRLLTLWLGNGGRPAAAGPAAVDIFLNDRPLASVTVGDMGPYRFAIPAELAASIARSNDAAQLLFVSRTWNPRALLGVADNRDLGVMVDRIELR